MPQRPDGDTMVALLGIVMSLFLVSRHAALTTMSGRRKAVYAGIWAVLLGLVAAVAARFGG